jgi:hypothetical protein
MRFYGGVLTVLILLFICSVAVYAQDTVKVEGANRFSHKGVKAMIGSANNEIIAERYLEQGEGGVLGVGYGFSNSFTLWVQFTGSEHQHVRAIDDITEFGGGEINLQYKFDTRSRLQPYGKLGFGGYQLKAQTSEVSLLGGGINLAFGLDFFFSRHFGVGVELAYKKIDYYFENTETEEARIIRDLFPNLNGDTFTFGLTLTVQ